MSTDRSWVERNGTVALTKNEKERDSGQRRKTWRWDDADARGCNDDVVMHDYTTFSRISRASSLKNISFKLNQPTSHIYDSLVVYICVRVYYIYTSEDKMVFSLSLSSSSDRLRRYEKSAREWIRCTLHSNNEDARKHPSTVSSLSLPLHGIIVNTN